MTSSKFLFSVFSSLLVLTGCGGSMPNAQTKGTGTGIEGYKHTLPFPRPDVRPGTALVLWSDGTLEPFCQPVRDYPAGELSNATTVDVTDTQQKNLKAEVKANMAKIADAKLGANNTTNIDITLSFTPIVSGNIAANAEAVKAKCQGYVNTFKAGKRKIRYLSLVTDIAEATVDYTIEVKSGVNASAEVAKELADATGVTASGSVDSDNDRKLHVKQTKLISNYNSDEDILSPMLN